MRRAVSQGREFQTQAFNQGNDQFIQKELTGNLNSGPLSEALILAFMETKLFLAPSLFTFVGN